MNFAKIEKSYKWVVVIDEQGIRKLYQEIKNYITEKKEEQPFIRITLDYSDGSSIITEDLEEVVKEENISGREIIRILIEAGCKNKQILVALGSKTKDEGNVTLQITGPDRQWIYTTKALLEDRLKTFKKLSLREESIFIGMWLVIMIFLFFLFFSSFNFSEFQNGKQWFSILKLFSIAVIFIIPMFLAGIFAKLFPNTTFLIGKEIERYKIRMKIRSNLFWVVVVGLIISLLTSLVIKFLPF